ncbi:MAG: type VI secretion system baseplate subunit TssF [Candidatus Adiutrix sp.]|jgi:type VI secretion system protein ImpG|nr:type VI secretion system baseplate subunit TssF [Candidatus Adiutrix sp.]
MEQSVLRNYYQRELRILREDGAAFAARYPKVAPRLGLAPGQHPDPMVERLLESLAYLTARVRQESEAELPALAGQVLGLMCPSLAAPVPSVSVVSFAPDYALLNKLDGGWAVPAGTALYQEPEGDSPAIRWRTGWPLVLSPARVTAASLASLGLKEFGGEEGECAVLRLRFSGVTPGQTMRLFLKGDRFSTFPLHDWAHSAAHRLFLVDDVERPDRRFIAQPLPREFLRPAGLNPDDLVLPGRGQSWAGFRLLQEYFACPERFLFWELGPWPSMDAFPNGEADLVLLLTEPPPEGLELRPEMFDPAAVPVVNLFERPAEPLRLDHRRSGYPLSADRRRDDSTEIHSLLSVTALAAGGRSFPVPHYADRQPGEEGLCWQMRLRPAPDERGTRATLFFHGGDMAEEVTIAARALCTNRHWAARRGCGRLSAEAELPAVPTLALPPSPQRDPVWAGEARWRLVGNFALAQESLSGPEGRRALQNILGQYAPPGDAYGQRQIAGVTKLSAEPLFHPLRPSPDCPMGGLARGLNIDLQLDEEAFRGGSPFIFAGVLEVFMGLRSAVNCLTRLRLFLDGRKGVYHQWPPRCGDRQLL